MARTATVSFGRFLYSLRARRGLSLGDVSELCRASAQTLDKGTLSRFERGLQRIPLATLVPLSRIYAVPADVILERLELDTELEGMGPESTEGLGREELAARGRRALVEQNKRWEAYGYFRDAAEIDGGDEPSIADRINLATVSRSLGKNALALHELTRIESDAGPQASEAPVIRERRSHCLRCLGDIDGADRLAQEVVREAEFRGDRRLAAFAWFSRGALAHDQGEGALAADALGRAFRLDREGRDESSIVPRNPRFGADTLLKLADVHLRADCLEKAGRTAISAKRLATRARLPAARAHSEIALGEVEERTGRPGRATQRWRRASDSANALHDRRMAFGAEFYLFRHALHRGERALARASRQRLERLLPWIPPHLAPVREYESLRGRTTKPPRKRATTRPPDVET